VSIALLNNTKETRKKKRVRRRACPVNIFFAGARKIFAVTKVPVDR